MAQVEVGSGCCKRVQELVENGEEMPSKYVWRGDNACGSIDLTAPVATDVPVIDLSRLVSSSSAMDQELVKLRSALSSWRCFQLVNHGIENNFLDEVRQVSREFFHQPIDEKKKYTRNSDDQEGYGDDIVLMEHRPREWTDRLELYVAPEEHQKLKYWPEKPESFRKVVNDYASSLRQIEERLLKSMPMSLSLPEDCFLKRYGERPVMYGRFNYYPPCSKPDQALGLRPHTDGCGLTFLLQDKEVEGLQVLKDGQWYRIPIIPHALFVFVADQMEILSNGIYKSAFHRVLTNMDRERSTVAMLCAPDIRVDIEPVEELVDEKRPRMYKTVRNYSEIYHNCSWRGEWPIDSVKI